MVLPARHLRFWSGAAVTCLPLWILSAASKPPSADKAPPVLLSTTGGGPKWPTVADLIAAAGKGDPVACYQYAQLLEEGNPTNQVAKDAAKAVAFYEKAGEAGHGPALFRLGKIYAEGLAGATVNYPRAYDFYLKAAQRGVAEGQYNVGAMLVSARGVRRDYVEGLAWLLVARKHGADAESGITQVKQRLQKTPQRIAAAEARAAQIEEELKEPKPRQAAAPAPGSPKPERPRIEKPDTTPVRIAPPAIQVPPPEIPAPRKEP
ncbi:MAG TPA: hypothetical protein VGD81_12510 [Opitutaceae bacterium]